MKLTTILKATCLTAILCAPSFAGVSVLDLGALEDCCGLVPNSAFPETIAAGDPATVAFNSASAGSGMQDSPSIALTDGATLSWGNVSGWNNNPDGDAGGSYFLRRSTDDPAIPTTFSVASANPGDMVTIDMVGSGGRDAQITFEGGSPVNVPVYAVGSGWTNIGSGTGTVGGFMELGMVPGADPNMEANIGAMRVTITPVPEPSCLALLGMGILALGLFRRR